MTKRYVYMENKTLKDHHRKSGCIDKFLKWLGYFSWLESFNDTLGCHFYFGFLP
jgi:hypothetical protein